MDGSYDPIGEYLALVRTLAREQFCAKFPHPFLVFLSDDGTLTPVKGTVETTTDRIMLAGKGAGGEGGAGYKVFPVKPAVAGAAQITVGCSSKADVRVDDVSVSRLHAIIELRGDRCFIMDNGSSTSTKVNDIVAMSGQWWEIEPGDSIVLGDVPLVFLGAAELYVFIKRLFDA